MDKLINNEFNDLSTLQARVACNIRKLRIKNNISQRDLAAWANMEYSNLCRIEAGKINITLRTLLRLSIVLGIDPSQLLELYD